MKEVLGIAKKEFQDASIDLVKRKRLLIEPENEKSVKVKATLIDKMAVEEEFADSHYIKPHWAKVMMETPVRIRDI